jgi:general stress protein 26
MTFQKLDPAIRDLAKGVNFGTLSFMLPSGRIASHVMWVDADDEHILINTDLGRIKYDSIKANPSVTIAMWKADNPYAYAEVRGRCVAEVAGQEAHDHIDACSIRYTGKPYQAPIQKGRVILKIAVEKQRSQNL